jgi:SAM-dependent methyltransferase
VDTGNAKLKQYWDDRLREHWGLHGAGSPVYGRQYNAWLYRLQKRAFHRLVRRLDLLWSEAHVLDVGTGTGFYVAQWQALGVRQIVGVDIAPIAVSRLRQAMPTVSFYEWDVADPELPLPRHTFDAVSACNVLPHLVDDARYRAALRNISRLLKSGGYLLYSDAFIHGEPKQYLDYWKGRSLFFIEAALQESGLAVLQRVPVYFLMQSPVDTRHPLWARVWERAIWPVRRSEWIGFAAGALFYPLEVLLVSLLRESPTTELVLCRKVEEVQ